MHFVQANVAFSSQFLSVYDILVVPVLLSLKSLVQFSRRVDFSAGKRLFMFVVSQGTLNILHGVHV